MSYPGLFAPVQVKGRWLVDGGLVDPVPVGVARAMGAGLVIAVDLNNRIVSRGKQLHVSTDVGKLTKLPAEGADNAPDNRNELIKKMADFYENAENRFKQRKKERLQP